MQEPIRRMSFGDYLRLEALDERPFEFFDGEVGALGAPSLTHGDILTNIQLTLGPIARAGGCRSYSGDATVESGQTFAARPDYVGTCDERNGSDPALRRRGVLRYPWLIVEVLSPTTAARDTNARRKRVTLFERDRGMFAFRGEVEKIALPPLDFVLTRESVYDGISMAALDAIEAEAP